MTTAQHTPSTGDDIENALDIIEQNGGAGEFEQRDEGQSIPRWLFPRYTPSCTVDPEHEMDSDTDDGARFTCSVCGTDTVLDPGDMYLSRSGTGEHDTDVETLAAWLAAPRNIVGGIMLLGEPGTGKTALAQAACTFAERKIVVITATPDHTKDGLMMHFVGEGNGIDSTPFTYGALVVAILNGYTVIVDEFLLFVDGIKPIFYPIADGSHWLPEALVDGSAAPIHPETRLIITANPQVRGSSLPEPIASRFAGTTLHIRTSANMLRDLGIDESLVAAWEGLGSANLWQPQIREMRVADYWLPQDATQAASALIPEHCPEAQREAVRNTVVSYLGGNLPRDGRLVVS